MVGQSRLPFRVRIIAWGAGEGSCRLGLGPPQGHPRSCPYGGGSRSGGVLSWGLGFWFGLSGGGVAMEGPGLLGRGGRPACEPPRVFTEANERGGVSRPQDAARPFGWMGAQTRYRHWVGGVLRRERRWSPEWGLNPTCARPVGVVVGARPRCRRWVKGVLRGKRRGSGPGAQWPPG